VADQQMRNPFQSEEDAFRVLVIIVAAATIVIASAVLISQTLGAILAVIAVALGLWKSAGWLRVALGEPDDDSDDPGPRGRDDEPPPRAP
jgi:hypothetical protein